MTRQRSRPAERATNREFVVVAAVLFAGSEKAAAHRLGLSHSTVKHHLANARSKVGVATTAQLVWIRGLRGLEGREMKTVTALLTNNAYGYPTRGARRRRKPTILACLHQTANAKATAMQERNYANRAGSWGPSATAYIDRNGTIVRAIDPAKYAAWSQGDVAHPNTKIRTIAAAVASGVNMNEWVHESIECSGAGTEPYTDAQFEAVAQLVAAASKALGIPINRSTVVVHADINSVSRRSDPWPPATREARVKRVIVRANAILRPPIVTVTVKAGDTLSEIASAHGLTLKALLAFPENAKYRANPGLIHPGDIVRVK